MPRTEKFAVNRCLWFKEADFRENKQLPYHLDNKDRLPGCVAADADELSKQKQSRLR